MVCIKCIEPKICFALLATKYIVKCHYWSTTKKATNNDPRMTAYKYNNFQTSCFCQTTQCFLSLIWEPVSFTCNIRWSNTQLPYPIYLLATVTVLSVALLSNESCWVLCLRANRFITTNWRECAFCNMKIHWWFFWLEKVWWHFEQQNRRAIIWTLPRHIHFP